MLHLRSRRPLRRLSFTREGKIFTLVTLGTGVAAINPGNNLLYLMLGLMLGLIIVSGVLSDWMLRRIDVRREMPLRAQAGAAFPVGFHVENRKSLLSAFALEVRDEIDGAPFRRSCFFLKIDPGEARTIDYRCEIATRGRARFSAVRISTRFPFGFFEKRTTLPVAANLLIWPAAIHPGQEPCGGQKEDEQGITRRAADGLEFFQLRDFRDGDDPRHIHWPTTARQGRMIVRDVARDTGAPMELVVDAADRQAQTGIDPELVIRIAAMLVRNMTAFGHTVRLITAGDAASVVVESSDPFPLMDHLSLLSPVSLRRFPPPAATVPGACLIGPMAQSSMPAARVPLLEWNPAEGTAP